ncbi:unnamed protein product, partial [Rotaria sp. Silwood2]
KRNDNHSWIAQAFLLYDLIEQNPEKDPSNKILDTALQGQVHKLNDDEACYMFRELKKTFDCLTC